MKKRMWLVMVENQMVFFQSKLQAMAYVGIVNESGNYAELVEGYFQVEYTKIA